MLIAIPMLHLEGMEMQAGEKHCAGRRSFMASGEADIHSHSKDSANSSLAGN